jgi:hypothetical protein
MPSLIVTDNQGKECEVNNTNGVESFNMNACGFKSFASGGATDYSVFFGGSDNYCSIYFTRTCLTRCSPGNYTATPVAIPVPVPAPVSVTAPSPVSAPLPVPNEEKETGAMSNMMTMVFTRSVDAAVVSPVRFERHIEIKSKLEKKQSL